MNTKLYSKSFDLKKSSLYGGRNQSSTKQTETLTFFDECTDNKIITNDDNGKWISTCEEINCP